MTAEPRILGGRYVLQDAVARGGMATVWKAHDDVLARTVAVKILHPHLAEDPSFLERFRREALAAARMTHPNVVSIYDSGADEDGPEAAHYIVMEYCEGGTLQDILSGRGPLPPEEAAATGATICDALAYAHDQGIVHRDIKPANVLLGSDGVLKVADFGIAKAAFASARDVTSTGSILGTVAYISPEQAKGEDPSAPSDLYSLGAVLYELVTGRPPFLGEAQVATAMKHIYEEPLPVRAVRPDVPRQLEATIMRALRKEPERRFASAREMASALSASAAGSTSVFKAPVGSGAAPTAVTPAARREPRPVAPARWSELGWVAGLVALVALVVLGIVAFGRDDSSNGGPGGGDGRGRAGGGAAVLEVASSSDLDPYGDGQTEHPESVPDSHDGNPATTWTTEDYSDPLQAIGKAGVGLVFDLGEAAEVGGVRISGEVGDFEIRAATSPPETERDAEVVASDTSSGGEVEVGFEPVTARYWIVWITRLPNDVGRATVAEVSFLAP